MDFGSPQSDPFGDYQFRQVQQSLPLDYKVDEEKKPKSKVSDAMMNAALASILMDSSQTSRLPGMYDEGWSEKNPILGNTPSSSKINGFFAAQLLGNALMNYAPPMAQNIYSSILLSNRIPIIMENRKLGNK